jgi:hypothetical protein
MKENRMKFKLEIDTGDNAFAENPAWKIYRILNTFCRHLEWESPNHALGSGNLYDINGNLVGQWTHE